jgi:malate dehydrogenase (oxaloacetate-decarboxylating)
MKTPPKTSWVAKDGAFETKLRGRQLLADPHLNRGVAFTEEERSALGLVGLLPPRVLTLGEQEDRALDQYNSQPTDMAKNVFLALLQDRNEVLFYRLVSDHLTEMMPIVYTPTVGDAIAHYSHEYRRPKGVFLSVNRPEDIEASLAATGLGADDVDLIIATDGESILGMGDWGVGGINISLGKLAIYVLGGIDPRRAIAVMLDVGTNRQSLLDDALYLGNRHTRVTGEAYDAFIDAYVSAATHLFPNALLHWEDLGPSNARRIVEQYQDLALTFNDDMQGTGSIALAAILAGLKFSQSRLKDQRVVIFGSGTAGIGIADRVRDAMVTDGLDPGEATRRFWCIGRHGLLIDSLDSLRDFQRPYARDGEDLEGLATDEAGQVGLLEVVHHVQPTVLIGTSGQPGVFTEDAVRAMAAGCERPIILPLSNPTELSEADPADVVRWTGGRALVATGSPFDPVTYIWTTYMISQANNALMSPGLGLGAITVQAERITDHMLHAAAAAVADQAMRTVPGGAAGSAPESGSPLLPEIESLRDTSLAVAAAVATAAVKDGVARKPLPDPLEETIRSSMWEAEYRPIRAV